ncbi:MAG TPA: GerMN domain-containing protein [Candidatus Acidoferrales bacterium]|nr:GerMN domain-containing protein [Candidatus Acidoferrales bacterium]
MPRNLKIILGLLAIAVVVGLISLRGLQRRMRRMAEARAAEESARHAVLAPPISTPTDVTVKAKIFWAAGPDKIAPVEVEMPLSADPIERSRQLLLALIANPPTAGQRTLPVDTALSSFYILPDGTAIADFSDAISSEMPSGLLSEELAVSSIARTLESNVPGLHRLKILIHGQEAETLAGNVDLTGFFDLNSAAASAPPRNTPPGAAPAIAH